MGDENVVVLPGIDRRDLLSQVPSEDVLQVAIARGVYDVVVVGRSRDGELYIASAIGDTDRVVGQLMRAVQYLASADVVIQSPLKDETQ